MGFFDIFKRRKNQVKENQNFLPQNKEIYEIILDCTEDGKLIVEMYEKKPKVGQFYDMTRLIVDNIAVDLNGDLAQKCRVSWYMKGEREYRDPVYEYFSAKNNYRNILANINISLILEDEDYGVFVMKQLLNQRRVTEYLNNGLQENPDRPCGQYVGGVKRTEDGYEKIFNVDLGLASHNSPEMCREREEYQRQLREIDERNTIPIFKVQQKSDDDIQQ